MSNSILLWSTLILPWLTLLFMKKEEVKRFLPVAWFTIVMNVILYEIGISLYFWGATDTVYPFTEIPPFFFGAYPVMTIWLFKLSYGKFRLYMTLNVVADAVFAFLFIPWLTSRGISYNSYPNYVAIFLVAISQAIVIYIYQMSQEGMFPSVQELFSTRLKPAVTKPFLRDKEDKR